MRTTSIGLGVAVMAASLTACSLSRSVISFGDGGVLRMDASFDGGTEEDSSREDDTGDFMDVLPADDVGTDAGATWAVDYRAGSFMRTSEASFLTRAPDDTSGFMSWAPSGTSRFEDRGDGAGALLLIEGARTNLLKYSRDPLVAASWTSPSAGPIVIADDVRPGPDGVMSAHQLTGSGYSTGQPLVPSGLPHAVSAWGRAGSTATVWTANFAYSDQPLTPAWYVPSQSTVWTRQSDTVPSVTGGSYFPIDLTIGPGVLDIVLDLHQVEAGRFASSAIRTLDTSATRDADVLTFPAAALPARLFSGTGHFDEVSPIFASSAVAAGEELWLLGIAGGNGIRLRHDGAALVLEAVEGGVIRATSAPVTFAQHQLLGRVEWSPTEGQLVVAGVAGPTGTAWSWPVGDVRIGGVVGGAGEAFARLGELAGN